MLLLMKGLRVWVRTQGAASLTAQQQHQPGSSRGWRRTCAWLRTSALQALGMAHVPTPPSAQAAAAELAPECVRSAFTRYVLGVASRWDKEEIKAYMHGVRQRLAREQEVLDGRAGSSLEFDGNRVYQQRFFIASFPGIYEGVWKRMTEGRHKNLLSCACVCS